MSTPADPSPENGHSDIDSIGSVVLVFDGPGDTTVRPCRPELLPHLLAVRQLYVEAGLLPPWPGSEEQKGQPDANPPSDKQE
jgi:hypothetical protein